MIVLKGCFQVSYFWYFVPFVEEYTYYCYHLQLKLERHPNNRGHGDFFLTWVHWKKMRKVIFEIAFDVTRGFWYSTVRVKWFGIESKEAGRGRERISRLKCSYMHANTVHTHHTQNNVPRMMLEKNCQE